MRILLDQNLSPRLIHKLADLLPSLETVYAHGLTGASDPFIFTWARKAGFSALISADRDFIRIAEQKGPPPKIIRIERCDFPSEMIEQLIRREILRIHDFLLSDRATLLLRIQAISPLPRSLRGIKQGFRRNI